VLMDVCSKKISSDMNDRAFRLLELHGTRFQFGGTPEVGCRNGLFTLKALHNPQRNHDLGSYVGFVDLLIYSNLTSQLSTLHNMMKFCNSQIFDWAQSYFLRLAHSSKY
jgi:hypothetical protein